MEKIKYFRTLKDIDRLTGVSKHRGYNLLEHSYMVAMLFKEFASKEDVPYTMAEFDLVLSHDLLEAVTGDLSYEVKNFSQETKWHWEEIECDVVLSHPKLKKYSDYNLKDSLNSNQYNLFKSCDTLDLWIFLKEEVGLGNNTNRVQEILNTCENLFQKYARGFPSILKFMEGFTV